MTGRDWLRALVLRDRNRPKATGGLIRAGDPPLMGEGCAASARQPAELPAGTLIEMRHDPPDVDQLLAALDRRFGSERAWALAHTDDDECVCCLGRYSRCHTAPPTTRSLT